MDVNTAAYRVVQLSIGELPKKSPVKSKAGKLGAFGPREISSQDKAKRDRAEGESSSVGPSQSCLEEKGENGNSYS